MTGVASVLRRPEAATIGLAFLALAAGGLLSRNFLDLSFILSSATLYAELGLVALVMTMILVSGEIDLSVASMIALSATVFAVLTETDLPFAVAVAGGLCAGALMGGLNALLIVRLGLPSLITTIGTLTLFRGLAQALLGDRSVTRFPEGWVGIDTASLLGVPAPLILLCLAALLAAFVLHATAFGRRVVLAGINPSAARHAGIGVGRVKAALLVASGLVCALAGLVMSSRLGVVRYDLAMGGELQAVLIVILGGASVMGGRGSILGTFAAFWLLAILQTAMSLANIGVERQLTILGALLILGVALTARGRGVHGR